MAVDDAGVLLPRCVLDARKEMINSIGMHFKLIPAGEFQMGSPDPVSDAQINEKPQHPVRIVRPFYLGVYPVTQEEYERVIGSNPSCFLGEGRRPVEKVSWFNAVAFCNRLSEMEDLRQYYAIASSGVSIHGGSGYRLPTEAEWEYACRARTTTTWSCGGTPEDLRNFAWFFDNSELTTHPAGQKAANPWGLHDMHGNVWEWCWDWYAEKYYANSPHEDPQGPGEGSCRVVRGGSWISRTANCRSACRIRGWPGGRSHDVGFRVARECRPASRTKPKRR